MQASWRPDCPVPLEDLRYVRRAHHGMTGRVVRGELVVHADLAAAIVEVFRDVFEAGFPITSMRLVDDFGADDDASSTPSSRRSRAPVGPSVWP